MNAMRALVVGVAAWAALSIPTALAVGAALRSPTVRLPNPPVTSAPSTSARTRRQLDAIRDAVNDACRAAATEHRARRVA